jgi:hypothetical protein
MRGWTVVFIAIDQKFPNTVCSVKRVPNVRWLFIGSIANKRGGRWGGSFELIILVVFQLVATFINILSAHVVSSLLCKARHPNLVLHGAQS